MRSQPSNQFLKHLQSNYQLYSPFLCFPSSRTLTPMNTDANLDLEFAKPPNNQVVMDGKPPLPEKRGSTLLRNKTLGRTLARGPERNSVPIPPPPPMRQNNQLQDGFETIPLNSENLLYGNSIMTNSRGS